MRFGERSLMVHNAIALIIELHEFIRRMVFAHIGLYKQKFLPAKPVSAAGLWVALTSKMQ